MKEVSPEIEEDMLIELYSKTTAVIRINVWDCIHPDTLWDYGQTIDVYPIISQAHE